MWNEADGPIKSQTRQQQAQNHDPIDVRRLISDHRNLASNFDIEASKNLSNSTNPRFYSVARSRTRSRFDFRREESSSSEDDSGSEGFVRTRSANPTLLRFACGGEEEEDEDREGRGNVKKMMSSAALGNYDKKIKKRVPLKFLDDEDDLSQHVEAIRGEFNKRNLAESTEEKSNEESYLSEKRLNKLLIVLIYMFVYELYMYLDL